jgi:hypothetical protein
MLREQGVFDLACYKSNALTESTCNFERNDGGPFHGHVLRIVDLTRGDDEPPDRFAAGSLAQVTASITRFDVQGPCWVPFVKRGDIAYEARITSDAGVGSVQGRIELETWGLCSARQYREIAHSMVENQIRDFVSSRIK